MFAQPILALLNRLLSQNAWAVQRMQYHAGQTVSILFGPARWYFRVETDGLIAAAVPDTEPVVSLKLPTSALLKLASGYFSEIAHDVVITGNAKFAESIFFVLQHLRLDIGAALSPIVGNILAHRGELALTHAARGMGEGLKRGIQAAADIRAENTTGFPLTAAKLQSFQTEIRQLAHHLDALENRLDRLAQDKNKTGC